MFMELNFDCKDRIFTLSTGQWGIHLQIKTSKTLIQVQEAHKEGCLEYMANLIYISGMHSRLPLAYQEHVVAQIF